MIGPPLLIPMEEFVRARMFHSFIFHTIGVILYESKIGTFERPIRLCERFEGPLLENDENGLQYDYSYAIKHEKRFHFTNKLE